MTSPQALEGIAIVGMAGRFPGAGSVRAFWENLCSGGEYVSTFTDEQLTAAGVRPEEFRDPAYVRQRAVLDRPEWFDAAFFDITPREAELTDPQQRLFLECCWEAFEDAGINPRAGKRSVGVFASASLNTYVLRQVFASRGGIEAFTKVFQADGYNILIGADKDYLCTRVAYKLDLRGPAMTVQTACSSSLVAIAQAVASLQSFQCDSALAGGVSVSFPQERGHIYQEGAIPTADGHCRAFDAAATGTVFGAGCGVILLKRLEDAVNDGDRIYAVLKSVALNNDGGAKMSYSAPSQDGQAEVIALAHALAGVSAADISYVEAHGTGTPVGDPIEVAALTQAFRTTTENVGFCALGSLKTNVGHLEAAAGVAGVIKVALALHHRHIPASLHFKTPNPNIAFAGSPFVVATRGQPWGPSLLPRRAGVSSFGVGGTNAHAVLEEAPPALTETPADPDRTQLLVLSARTGSALESMTAALAGRLQALAAHSTTPGGTTLADVAGTLRHGRAALEHRRIVTASTLDEAAARLQAPARAPVCTGQAARARVPEVVFLFPGQGAQYAGMARELHAREPVFREHVETCLALLPQAPELRPLLLDTPREDGDASQRLLQTSVTQPALFIVEYALARLWMSWGVQPSACIGHSLGEYVAAVLAGVFTLEEALFLLTSRASLMQSMPPGGMLSIRLPEAEVAGHLTGSLALAVVNAPQLCVVSGERGEIEALRLKLEAAKVACRTLFTSHAFHSPMMAPVMEPFIRQFAHITLKAPTLPLISTLTGKTVAPDTWTAPDYWARQLREPVRFADAATTAFARIHAIFLEVGPGQTLSSLIRQRKDRPESISTAASMPPLGEPGEHAALLSAAGQLWTRGVPLDWAAFDASCTTRRADLPTYPFERKRFWFESQPESPATPPATALPPAEKLEATIVAQLEVMQAQLRALARS